MELKGRVVCCDQGLGGKPMGRSARQEQIGLARISLRRRWAVPKLGLR
jgi:hypothetical protein